MHHEHRSPDRTDHRREIESRRADRRGPSPRQVERALDKVATHDVPGTPKAHQIGALVEVHSSEWKTDTREVKEFRIQEGDPLHGAHRSEDHLSRYEVELPIAEVEDGTVNGDRCPECGGKRALYKYRAHHFIAGGESLFCTECEALLHSEEWG